MKDMENFIEHEEDCYKPVRTGISYSESYMKYETNGGRNKTLSKIEYFNGIKPYIKSKHHI